MPYNAGLEDNGMQRSLLTGTVAMATAGAWNVGTCLATAKLVEEMGGEVVGARFAIELASECGGRDNLKGYDVYSAIVY